MNCSLSTEPPIRDSRIPLWQRSLASSVVPNCVNAKKSETTLKHVMLLTSRKVNSHAHDCIFPIKLKEMHKSKSGWKPSTLKRHWKTLHPPKQAFKSRLTPALCCAALYLYTAWSGSPTTNKLPVLPFSSRDSAYWGSLVSCVQPIIRPISGQDLSKELANLHQNLQFLAACFLHMHVLWTLKPGTKQTSACM